MLQDNSNKITQQGVQPGEEIVPSLENTLKYLKEFGESQMNILGSMAEAFSKMEAHAAKIRHLFGGTELMGETFKNTLIDAIPTVVYLGGKLEDAGKMQLGVLRATQTQTLLNTDSYSKLFATMALVSDGTINAGKMTEEMTRKFIDTGYALENIGTEMEGVINTAREIGVSTSAVYNQISANMGKLNLFGFENGVQGMAKMAADAALLRIDMGKTLNLADKLFDPEKAIQMANTFQRLGVSVSSLLDPNKLQDMARHDPAKLQSELGEALKAYTIFDEQARKMKLTEFGMGVVRELSTEIGMSTEELSKFATNVGDLDRKMGEITFNKEFFGDKETQKMIAGLSQLGGKGTKFDNQYYVTLEDEKGNKTQKLTAQLTRDDIKSLENAVKPKDAIDLQRQANSALNNINNTLESIKGLLGRRAIRNQDIRNSFNSATSSLSKKVEEKSSEFGLGFKKTKTGEIRGDYGGVDKTISDFYKSGMVQKYTNAIGSGATDLMKTIDETSNEYLNKAKSLTGKDVVKAYDEFKKKIENLNVTQKPSTSSYAPTPENQKPSTSSYAPKPANQKPSTSSYVPAKSVTSAIKANSKVDVVGTINIKVDPVQSEFDKSMARALDRADIQNKIMTVIKQNELANNNSIGNGKVSNMPSTAMS